MKNSFVVRSNQRQLFLDDYGIEESRGLKRTMHQPQKRGALIRADRHSGEKSLYTQNTPIWDPTEKIYKFVINYYGMERCYKSTDGLHWFKGQKGGANHLDSLKEWQKQKFNIDEFDEAQAKQLEKASDSLIVYDPTEKNEKFRYKGAIGFLSGYQPVASPDCEIWSKMDTEPIRTHDTAMLSYDPQEKMFLLTGRCANLVRDPEYWSGWRPQAEQDNRPLQDFSGELHERLVYLFTSKDFRTWSKPGKLAFHADVKDQELGRQMIEERFLSKTHRRPYLNIPEKYKVSVYSMRIFRYEGLYIGLPSMHHSTGKVSGDWEGFDHFNIEDPAYLKGLKKHGSWDGLTHVQLTSSRDLTHWERLGERRPFIDSSPLGGGDYDLSCVDWPSEPIILKDELWFYYTGTKFYGFEFAFDHEERQLVRDKMAICLAVLRRDGFISLEAEKEEGMVLTKAFELPSGELYINTDAHGGKVEVQLCDKCGEPIPGFQSVVSGDHTEAKAAWSDGDLRSLINKSVRLRFTVKNAHLYAYWFN